MTRGYNFSAGPATLPLSVLQQAQAELLEWHDLGVSLMELGHRTPPFVEMVEKVEHQLRQLLAIPADYHVLFLPGGARIQFAMLPLNLLRDRTKVDYVDTGIWSQIALQEAQRYADVHTVASAAASNYTTIPDVHTWQCRNDAAYVHYTDNETMQGVEFHTIPACDKDVVLATDMTSSLLSKPLAIDKFGIIYAGAQKNLGIAGLSVVIVRADLVGQAHPHTPTVYNYQKAAETRSLYATPPTYPWYITGLVCDWVQQQGGVAALAAVNARKAAKLYAFIDNNAFYANPVAPAYRSRMNVVFTLANPGLNETFLTEAQRHGLHYLKGHSLVGGMRASIYNALPESGVDALLVFMQDFVRRYG